MSFEIKDRAAAGRLGVLETPHGRVHTPTLLPVINPNLPTIPPSEMGRLFGAEMLITNSYILRQRAELRERVLRDGVHRTIGWDGALMTDSGTFQSYVYGAVAVKPEEIVDFQREIGVDVGTILDVFTTPDRTHDEAETELDETLRRAADAVPRKGSMLLAGTVQGGVHLDLRERSAKGIAALDIDVVPIGGVVPLMEQSRYATLARVILAAKRHLPTGRPVHLFGAGHPLVFPLAAALGCDLFDSASYAKFAKDGRMMFAGGTRHLDELTELGCPCPACARWKGAHELRRADAKDRERSLAEHNLHVSFAEIRRIRQAIRDGNLWELVEERATQNPALLDALRALAEPSAQAFLEGVEPVSAQRAFTYRGPHSMSRPLVARLHERLLTRYQFPSDVCILLGERNKPYGDAYAAYLDAFREKAASLVVESPFGPVPLELDLMFPIAQSVLPEQVDEEARRVAASFRERFFARLDGCDVLPFDRELAARPEGPTAEALQWMDERRVHATAQMQFGVQAAKGLLAGALAFRRSEGTGRVRNILVDREHVASVRAEDGLISLRMLGAERIRRATTSPALRLIVDPDARPFIREGKNVIAKTVLNADPALRPGDDALIVSPDDELLGVGRMLLAPSEIATVTRGLAAKTMDHAEGAHND